MKTIRTITNLCIAIAVTFSLTSCMEMLGALGNTLADMPGLYSSALIQGQTDVYTVTTPQPQEVVAANMPAPLDLMINKCQVGNVVEGTGYYAPNTTTDTYTTTSTSSSSTTQKERVCPRCHGEGSYKKTVNVGTFGIDTSKRKCDTCGEWMMAGSPHTHLTCPECHGRKTVNW